MTSLRREYRGVITVLRLDESVEEPGGLFHHREACRPVSENSTPDNVFENLPGLDCVFEEFAPRHLVDQPMRTPVRSYFVPSLVSLFDQVRESARNPAEKEAGHPHVPFTEEVQKPKEGLLDAGGQRIPLRGTWSGRQVQNVKPVFNVDGEDARHDAVARRRRSHNPVPTFPPLVLETVWGPPTPRSAAPNRYPLRRRTPPR